MILDKRSRVLVRDVSGRRGFGASCMVGATRIREVMGEMDDGERAARISECGF